MGQIFSWEDVQAGRIPKRDCFKHVENLLHLRLAAEPAIVSASLFGSVVRGDFNVRSDIDCVVVYDAAQEQTVVAVLHEIDRVARGLHVPINFTPCDTVLAGTRLHHFGQAFLRHLRASIEAGGLIKGDLAGMLAATIPVEQEIESYMRFKMYGLQESLAQVASYSEERLMSFLKKAYEAPVHVARKMLIYEGTLRGDSKKEVRRRYCEVMPPALSERLDRVLKLDHVYSAELTAQLHLPNEGKYRMILDRLKTQLPEVLAFLRANILRLDQARR